jgi:hypothetical protein
MLSLTELCTVDAEEVSITDVCFPVERSLGCRGDS